MPSHWTYEAFEPDSDLMQGDVLEPTEGLQSVFRQVHPHFLDPKYTGFLLLTQSCDLVVRKKGRYNTRYLNVAVIRPLEAVLDDLLRCVCRPVVQGVYLQETKRNAYQLFERLFNQNEQALGLFYLHTDEEAGIFESSVALLKVAVTLRVEHYSVLQEARRGRLGPEFRSKLGWLVGNLYSRIGTQDWSEPPERREDLKKLIKERLEGGDEPYGPLWVPETWVVAAKEQDVRLEQLDRQNVLEVLEAHKPPSAKSQVIEQVLRIVSDVAEKLDEQTLNRIGNRLGNDKLFAKAIRSAKLE